MCIDDCVYAQMKANPHDDSFVTRYCESIASTALEVLLLAALLEVLLVTRLPS